jgi:hypothetical protein
MFSGLELIAKVQHSPVGTSGLKAVFSYVYMKAFHIRGILGMELLKKRTVKM